MTDTHPAPVRFVLASASPARLATLRRAGLEPEVVVSGVDERSATGTTPADLVAQLAAAKARAVAAQLGADALVLGCDSMLDLDGTALGKPRDHADAVARWRAMRGRTGALRTGHCLIDTVTGRSTTRSVATDVRFADVTDAEIELYCASGEPLAAAGAFTIDGLGSWFVEGVAGDHHNVVGVSLPAVRAMLRELGHELVDIGYPG